MNAGPDLVVREVHVLAQRQRDVLVDVQAIEERGELKREADRSAQIRPARARAAREILPVAEDAAAVGLAQAVEQPQDRRLAGAGEPDDARDRALDDVEREVLHHDRAPHMRAYVVESRHDGHRQPLPTLLPNKNVRQREVEDEDQDDRDDHRPVVEIPTPAAPPRVLKP